MFETLRHLTQKLMRDRSMKRQIGATKYNFLVVNKVNEVLDLVNDIFAGREMH